MSIAQAKTMPFAAIRLVIAACFMTGAGLLHAQNLLTNGGFESGLTGWSNATSGGAVASFSLETVQPYEGARAMKVVVTNPSTQLHNVQTLGATFTTLPTGTPTTITLRARAAVAGTTVRLVMQSSAVPNQYKTMTFTLSTSWERYSWNHTTAEPNPQLKIQYRSAGTIWLDDIAVEVHPIPTSGILVTLDPGIRHQTMDGIGGALTWYSSRMLALPTAKKAEVEQQIFDDLGLDIIRLKNWYFPADWPTNKSPSNIPTTGGFKGNYYNNKTFYDMAKKNGRDISILFSSWSPPAILKTNNDLQNGGTLKKVNGQYVYADLAQYWVDLLDNMNWTPDYLSFQNEPGWVATHETCEFGATQTSTLAGFPEALDAIHNRTKNRPNAPILIGPESENMNAFLTDVVPLRTRTYLSVNAFHNYNVGTEAAIDGEISKFNQIRSETDSTGRRNWMSEYSNGAFDWLDTAKIIHNTLVEADSSAYIFWKLVWGDSTSPDEIVFNINGADYVKGNTYYALKHYAKHISRGHQRFEVSKATGTNTNIRVSGYLNPAGNQVTLIVLNTGATDDEIALRLRGLPVTAATSFRTRQFDIASIPFEERAVNLASNLLISKSSITTYVFNLAETLNPYTPELLRVDEIRQQGNQVSLTMPSQPGQKFILWRSTSLATGSWQKVTNAIFTESDGQLILTDPTPSPVRASYRVQHDNSL
jgi:glucuronoarabinoxylan endo-1,4-beta-xylanase